MPSAKSASTCDPGATSAQIAHPSTLTISPRRPRNPKGCPANGPCFNTAAACAAKAANPFRMSVTPAASQTQALAVPRLPDHRCRRCASGARKLDLDMSIGCRSCHWSLRLCHDLHWQEAHNIGPVGIGKPGIAEPGNDQIGVPVLSPGNLAHRHTGHPRLPADHPLPVARPDPALRPLRQKQPR